MESIRRMLSSHWLHLYAGEKYTKTEEYGLVFIETVPDDILDDRLEYLKTHAPSYPWFLITSKHIGDEWAADLEKDYAISVVYKR